MAIFSVRIGKDSQKKYIPRSLGQKYRMVFPPSRLHQTLTFSTLPTFAKRADTRITNPKAIADAANICALR